MTRKRARLKVTTKRARQEGEQAQRLGMSPKDMIGAEKLTAIPINVAQQLLKKQFPDCNQHYCSQNQGQVKFWALNYRSSTVRVITGSWHPQLDVVKVCLCIIRYNIMPP